jgi:hypothetical protein
MPTRPAAGESAAHAAVVVGELLVELGEGAAEVRPAVGEEHAHAGLGEVQGRLDAGDPGAHDEGGLMHAPWHSKLQRPRNS